MDVLYNYFYLLYMLYYIIDICISSTGGGGEDLWEQGRLSERARHRSAGDRPHFDALHPPLRRRDIARFWIETSI